MVFSTSSRNVRVEHDPGTDQTFLRAECKSDSGNWQASSICLDDHLGINAEYKGFDTTQERTASAQGQSLRSLLVPDSLTLKGVSVLCGKVREEYGGWDTFIYLDVLFKNVNGDLERVSWSNCLLESAAALTVGGNYDGNLKGLLLTPNGNLTASQLSVCQSCEWGDCEYGRFHGTLQPLRGGAPDKRVSLLQLGYWGKDYLAMEASWDYRGNESQQNKISFRESLSNAEGKLSPEQPAGYDDQDSPLLAQRKFQSQLPSVGLAIAGVNAFSDKATSAIARCVCTSTICAGILVTRIFYGQLGASYASALAFMAGSAVESATGPFVGDPEMKAEVAAVAIYRVLKAELPAITGMTLQEMFEFIAYAPDSDPDDRVPDAVSTSTAEILENEGLDASILGDVRYLPEEWVKITRLVKDALTENKSEDELKRMFQDNTHDGVDLLPPRPTSPPPPEKKNPDLAKWMQDIIAVQDQLYLLEPDVGDTVEESTAQALEAITNGLTGLNDLLEFWPDYKGDDATNEQRLAIIQSTTDLVANGQQDVKDTDEDTSILDKVLALEENLNSLKTQFRDETAAEQAELDKIKPELQTAVEKMFADQKLYQSAQSKLLAKIKEISDAELKHDPDATIEGGVKWYKDLLRRRTSAREETQSLAAAAAATYLQSEETVVNLQARQAELNNTHKRRFSVEREITKAEMIIDDLKIMINGTKQQEDRILSVVDLLSSTLDDLTHVGEPPYHRQDRKIADQMCMTVLKVHRESLIDPSFVDSARDAVTAIQSWFDDYMPKSVQEEIDAIVNNPLYQQSKLEDVEKGVEEDVENDDEDNGLDLFG